MKNIENEPKAAVSYYLSPPSDHQRPHLRLARARTRGHRQDEFGMTIKIEKLIEDRALFWSPGMDGGTPGMHIGQNLGLSH